MSAVEKLNPDAQTFKTATAGATQLIKAMSAEGQEFVRDKSFVVTVKDIVAIRKYEWFAFNFPDSTLNVTTYIGGESTVPGLQVCDFQRTFNVLRQHARKWSPLEQDIRNLSTQLHIFSKSMTMYASKLATLCDRLDARSDAGEEGVPMRFNELLAYYKEVQESDADIIAFNQLEQPDENIKETLEVLVDKMLKQITVLSDATVSIHKRLVGFHNQLREEVVSEVNTRCQALKQMNNGAEMQALDDRIARQRTEIAEMNKEYNDKVRESVGGALGGLKGGDPFTMIVSGLGGLAMAIFTGIEAENVRARRNQLEIDLDQNIAHKTSLSQKHGQMEAVRAKLSTADKIMNEASCGLGNMQSLWKSLETHTLQSASIIPSITDRLLLMVMATQLRELASPWEDVGSLTGSLQSVFIDAEEVLLNEQRTWK